MFRAKHIMTRQVITVRPDAPVEEAIDLMLTNNVSGLPVIDSAGQLVGIITEYDLLTMVFDCFGEENRVSNYMNENPTTVSPETDWIDIVDVFRKQGIKRVPVMEDEKIVGVISRIDVLRTARDSRRLVREVLAQQTLTPKQ